MMRFLLLFCLLTFAVSCDNRQKVNELEKQTEEIHDAAMKEMAAMNRTARALKKDPALTDSIFPGKETRQTEIRETLKKMEKAEADMMAWMTGYQPPKNLPAAEAEKYLLEQKRLIELNQKDIHDALEKGKLMMNEQ